MKWMIKKAVIPAAGLGTRLLSVTKEQPKEMLPLFSQNLNGGLCLKPVLQLIFEQLFDTGFREFCFIVGRGRRVVKSHFTPDYQYIDSLNGNGKNSQALDLEDFYKKIEKSELIWINQPEPKGFGHAVLMAKSFIEGEPFLVHAGDDLILSNGNGHIKRLINVFGELKADGVLLGERMEDPRRYGVIEGIQVSEGICRVKRIVEKPRIPPSNMATVAIYVFKPTIHYEIEGVKPDKSGEIQLTDSIQSLIDKGGVVYAAELREGKRIDVGTPETYWKAQQISHKYFQNKNVSS